MAEQDTETWRDRAILAEARIEVLRQVLLDVDVILNLSSREPTAIMARLRRDERPISRRVQDVLLATAETHCRNWAYGCGPGECSCRCKRCPAALTEKSSLKTKP